MITVSVPGKVHLMGEHAVVYGKPALLAAINKRLEVTVTSSDHMEIQTTESTEFVVHALEKIREYFRLSSLPPMKISIVSEIPGGFHLGSSAAAAVGVVAGVTYFLKKIWNPDVFNHIAYEVEKKQHGNPSGGDNTIVTTGGILWFRKEFEFLKTMWKLDMRIPTSLDHFFLINTGKPKETTGEMVNLVRLRYKKNPSLMRTWFDKNEDETKRIVSSLREENETQLLDAINRGEQTLEHMGVVSKKVIPCIQAIVSSGGAAKILGGGGKKEGVGFLLCYHKNALTVAKIAHQFGYQQEAIHCGAEGVTLKTK